MERSTQMLGEIMEVAWLVPSIRLARPYTLLGSPTLAALGMAVNSVIRERVEGAIVECGVWRGGASFLMADVLSRRGDTRNVWMFDSFEGMPPTEPVDGPAARKWEETADPISNHCTASIDDVESTRQALGLFNTRLVKGWYQETLPPNREDIGPIALLHIDCDWHSSVTTCLENLYDQVVHGGYVLIDDYYAWDGCAVAVHEFLGARGLSHRLTTSHGTAYFRKF
jgi:hypothetical protein